MGRIECNLFPEKKKGRTDRDPMKRCKNKSHWKVNLWTRRDMFWTRVLSQQHKMRRMNAWKYAWFSSLFAERNTEKKWCRCVVMKIIIIRRVWIFIPHLIYFVSEKLTYPSSASKSSISPNEEVLVRERFRVFVETFSIKQYREQKETVNKHHLVKIDYFSVTVVFRLRTTPLSNMLKDNKI